jgi:diketogulonate reductase-like aldo/keto reductase
LCFLGVERFLAHAIKDSGVDRSDLFLTTKLWPKDYGFQTAQTAAAASLERLGTDYLDLVRNIFQYFGHEEVE